LPSSVWPPPFCFPPLPTRTAPQPSLPSHAHSIRPPSTDSRRLLREVARRASSVRHPDNAAVPSIRLLTALMRGGVLRPFEAPEFGLVWATTTTSSGNACGDRCSSTKPAVDGASFRWSRARAMTPLASRTPTNSFPSCQTSIAMTTPPMPTAESSAPTTSTARSPVEV
jgi:hypothetical protein